MIFFSVVLLSLILLFSDGDGDGDVRKAFGGGGEGGSGGCGDFCSTFSLALVATLFFKAESSLNQTSSLRHLFLSTMTYRSIRFYYSSYSFRKTYQYLRSLVCIISPTRKKITMVGYPFFNFSLLTNSKSRKSKPGPTPSPRSAKSNSLVFSKVAALK